MISSSKIRPCLWFDHAAEEAANFYVSLFPDSRVTKISRYGEAGPGAPGAVMLVAFELAGQPFMALNGGPIFTFTEACSFSSIARIRPRSISIGSGWAPADTTAIAAG